MVGQCPGGILSVRGNPEESFDRATRIARLFLASLQHEQRVRNARWRQVGGLRPAIRVALHTTWMTSFPTFYEARSACWTMTSPAPAKTKPVGRHTTAASLVESPCDSRPVSRKSSRVRCAALAKPHVAAMLDRLRFDPSRACARSTRSSFCH